MWELFWAFIGLMFLCFLIFNTMTSVRVHRHVKVAHRIEHRIIRDHLIWPDTPQWNTALHEMRTQFDRLIKQIETTESFPTVADEAIKAIVESRDRYIAVLETKISVSKHKVDCRV